MNAPVNRDLFGDTQAGSNAKPLACLPSSGFMPAAKVPLPVAPPSKHGPRRVVNVDSFAGGGGASNGCEMALSILSGMGLLPNSHSLKVNFAINHDAPAIAMHTANHPDTVHLPHNVWKVNMLDLLGDNYFGLLWLSPDCRDHSPAKGGPITSKSVRDLAWVLVRWLKELPEWQRPWSIFLENVGAFSKWSPLLPLEGGGFERDKSREGEIFHRFVKAIAAFGYSVGWKEIVACEHGTPTIRKRLKMVCRRDGKPITWPKPTHGDPKSEAVTSGTLKPWPVAADIIDFDRPSPSIFMTKVEAAEYTRATGTRIIRPLAKNTEARIAKGVKRYILDAAEPFIVTCNHGGDGFRGQGLGAPLMTVTKARDAHGLVHASIASANFIKREFGNSVGSPMQSPVGAITAGGGGKTQVVSTGIAPFISHGQHGGRSRPMDAPHHTVTASTKDQNQLIATYIVQHNGGERAPIGRSTSDPLSTVTVAGSQQNVVAAHMMSLKGSDRRAGSCERPHAAICASGQHSAVVTLPMLSAYYGTGEGAAVSEPCRTVTTRDRFGLVEGLGGIPPLSEAQLASARQVAAFLRRHDCWDDRELVTIEIGENTFVIFDIGMRMLTPRELARAQGFPESYILDAPYKNGRLSETQQRHKIGNSVCKEPASAVIVENYRPPLEWGFSEYLEAAE